MFFTDVPHILTEEILGESGGNITSKTSIIQVF